MRCSTPCLDGWMCQASQIREDMDGCSYSILDCPKASTARILASAVTGPCAGSRYLIAELGFKRRPLLGMQPTIRFEIRSIAQTLKTIIILDSHIRWFIPYRASCNEHNSLWTLLAARLARTRLQPSKWATSCFKSRSVAARQQKIIYNSSWAALTRGWSIPSNSTARARIDG